MKKDIVLWLQLLALVGGFSGVGTALGQSLQRVDTNTTDLQELAEITRDLAGSSIKTQAELADLARRVARLEGLR